MVEHDEETIRAAFGSWRLVQVQAFTVERGPRAAGQRSGIRSHYRRLIEGRQKSKCQESAAQRMDSRCEFRSRQNNLQNLNVEIPLGVLVCVTGASGSGKSSLVHDIVFKKLASLRYDSRILAGSHDALEGHEAIDDVIDIDQSPIGRTPRSNPATYISVFTDIRDLFAQLPESKIRGYKTGRFSFNVKGGRCEECQGGGMKLIEMNFLPDVYVECEKCMGKRYNRETLEVRYRGTSQRC